MRYCGLTSGRARKQGGTLKLESLKRYIGIAGAQFELPFTNHD
jgi:hypothetical protein